MSVALLRLKALHAGGVVLLLCLASVVMAGPAESPADLEVFVREGCPHCAAAKTFLTEWQRDRPALRVLYQDVGRDSAALRRLRQLAADQGILRLGVPSFYVRGQLIVGYRDAATTGARLIELLESAPPSSTSESADACRIQPGTDCTTTPVNEPDVILPWLGRLSARDVGLPLFTVAVGLLDGFNPCAMWVLLFLLSLLASLRNRFKMGLVAGTFVLVSGLVYLAFMAAWLNVFLLMGLSRAVQVGLGTVAVFIGTVNVKDFVAFRQGLSLTIPDSAKPGLYARMRAIVQAENLTGAMIGIVVLAVLVNFIELLCTAGFPALYTQVLTMHQLPMWQYYGYLVLYNLAYIFDDAVMVTIAVITLGRRKLAEHEGRWLKLISGTVMIGLGLVLLVKPDLLAG